LDDAAMLELDDVIAKIMKKERKPKMKPPVGSSKDPDIEFRERAASLLFSYAKKANTVALLELLPALLSAIAKLQQQQILQTKKKQQPQDGDSAQNESQKRRIVTQFYKSVIVRLSDIIKEICHTRGTLAQQLTPTQKDKLFSQLIPFCASEKGAEISKLAVDALFLVNRSTEQLTKLLKNSSSKIVKPVVKYPLYFHFIPSRTQIFTNLYPTQLSPFLFDYLDVYFTYSMFTLPYTCVERLVTFCTDDGALSSADPAVSWFS